MDDKIMEHEHSGVDSKKLQASIALFNCPQDAIAAPSGGATVDTQARTAIAAILTELRNIGLIRT